VSFASVGTLGTGSTKAAGRTVAMTVGAAVPVGDLVVVWVAWDAHGPAGGSTSGNGTPREGCSDSKGNIYTQLGGHEDSSTANPAFAVFVSQLRVALAIGDTITAANSSAVPVAKGITAWQFTCGGRWAHNDRGTNRVTTLGADPASISYPGALDSQEYLNIHCLAAKGPSTDAYTWDTDYTQVGTAGTTGGVDTSNCTVTGGFRIATLTGDTVDVTSDTADRNYLQGLYALCEVTLPTFPLTPVLDTFNRADENPLDNGTWDASACCALTTTHCRLVSNQAAGVGGSWWGTSLAAGDGEVYCTVPVKSGTAGVEGPGLALNASGCSQTSTRTGYGCEWETAATSDRDQINVGQLGNATGIAGGLVLYVFIPAVNGDKIGLCKVNQTMHTFVDVGSGWEPACAIYWQQFSLNSGEIGLTSGETNARMDDFGGGTRPAIVTNHLLPILGVGA